MGLIFYGTLYWNEVRPDHILMLPPPGHISTPRAPPNHSLAAAVPP